MSRIRGKNTSPELVVRRLAHRLGFRFRLHRRDLPGCPDMVFPRLRKVIQVHGCFWHQHPGCRRAHAPKSRLDYWAPKLARNVARDETSQAALSALGWEVLVMWECEVKNEVALTERLLDFLRRPAVPSTATSTEAKDFRGALQRFSTELERCLECEENNVTRVISALMPTVFATAANIALIHPAPSKDQERRTTSVSSNHPSFTTCLRTFAGSAV